MYFLFRNGVILYGGAFKKSKLTIREGRYQTTEWQEYAMNTKSSWGVFVIEDNTIKFERWYPSETPLRAYIRAGEILNDTTFLITESYRMRNGEKTEVREKNETYHFRQFSPKPDSTNSFIE